MEKRNAFSTVVLEENHIIARANIKDIENGNAFVGYRVAQQATSKGAASFCLSQLINIAKQDLKLRTLKAHVLDNNPASKRVLEKAGFRASKMNLSYVQINRQTFNCAEFNLHL